MKANVVICGIPASSKRHCDAFLRIASLKVHQFIIITCENVMSEIVFSVH